MDGAVISGLSSINSIISLFASPPFVYFVAVALVGAVSSVALKFVPMRRR